MDRGIMILNGVFLNLSVAAECFLLYALAHFAFDNGTYPGSSQEDHESERSRSNTAPLLFFGPASIAVWSIGTWDTSSQARSTSNHPTRKSEESFWGAPRW